MEENERLDEVREITADEEEHEGDQHGARSDEGRDGRCEEELTRQSVEEEDYFSNEAVPIKKRKCAGAASYSSKFNSQWVKEWPFIRAGSTPFHFWCTVCRIELECRHQGRADVVRHVGRESHNRKEKILESTSKLDRCIAPGTANMAQTRRSEVKVAAAMVQHNIPLAFSDHLSPLFKECFPDSDCRQISLSQNQDNCHH